MTLNQYIIEKGLTNTQFALTVGLSHVQIHRYRKGKAVPSHAVIKRVIAATNGAVMPGDWFPE